MQVLQQIRQRGDGEGVQGETPQTLSLMKSLVVSTAFAILAAGSAMRAEAGGCYTSLAANIIAESIRGGLTSSQAVQQASNEGYLNSQACLARTIGYMRSLPYL
jgi:hypothetical protein